jgi:hypothetical protein
MTESQDQAWKARLLIAGGLLGALTGVGIAGLLIQRAEREGVPPRLATGEGIRLGLLVLGLLRQVSELGAPKD